MQLHDLEISSIKQQITKGWNSQAKVCSRD